MIMKCNLPFGPNPKNGAYGVVTFYVTASVDGIESDYILPVLTEGGRVRALLTKA